MSLSIQTAYCSPDDSLVSAKRDAESSDIGESLSVSFVDFICRFHLSISFSPSPFPFLRDHNSRPTVQYSTVSRPLPQPPVSHCLHRYLSSSPLTKMTNSSSAQTNSSSPSVLRSLHFSSQIQFLTPSQGKAQQKTGPSQSQDGLDIVTSLMGRFLHPLDLDRIALEQSTAAPELHICSKFSVGEQRGR
ncbi:hypothetical protein BD777DRAFT_15939 [Yarrowia lipolytica]|jgi:hypothetical protein|uniref:Uncharacterized protein n=1 Tax=Yarrowia lipolytica TaxID=4952 RepID=A0A1D8N9C5_YARLL|nr:hypothetical protein YALI1_C03286g [Yarrowia lipolytica]RMI94997.1 hypothetical protein BD777DRAFT_15939 [Yarrowia lipolytica]